jgi:hypothetical protein
MRQTRRTRTKKKKRRRKRGRRTAMKMTKTKNTKGEKKKTKTKEKKGKRRNRVGHTREEPAALVAAHDCARWMKVVALLQQPPDVTSARFHRPPGVLPEPHVAAAAVAKEVVAVRSAAACRA